MPRKVMLSFPLQPLPPNPSIEGMPKRLRLLCTPHVKR
jgi:RimJ/RimL family protein N-acetyltransferase